MAEHVDKNGAQGVGVIQLKVEREEIVEVYREVRSPTFFVRNVPWNIRMVNTDHGLRCYLVCLEETSGFSCNTSFKFSILGTPYKKIGTHKFSADVPLLGFIWFWNLPPLNDLVLNGAINLELELSVEEPARTPLEPSSDEDKLEQLEIQDDEDAGLSDVNFMAKNDGETVKDNLAILTDRSPEDFQDTQNRSYDNNLCGLF